MKITLLVAAAAAVAGGTTFGLSDHGSTGPATAPAAAFQGQYTYQAPGSGAPFATTWTVTPCGSGCVHITTASGLTDTDAHLKGSDWVFEKFDAAGIVCDNRKVLPATVQFVVDPHSLHGTLQPQGSPCGGTSRASAFTLTKLT